MTTILKLDSAAVASLFPEGSTARVELQQAVLANIIGKTLKPSWVGSQVEAQIKLAQDTAVAQVLREMGLITPCRTQLSLPDNLKLQFKEQARIAVAEAVAPLVRLAVEERTSSLSDGVMFEVKRRVGERIDAEINAAVKAKVLAALTAATT